MKAIYFEMGPLSTGQQAVFIRMQGLFERWDMEKWLAEMVPNVEVHTDNTSSNLRDNEIMIYCDATDASRIRLIL